VKGKLPEVFVARENDSRLLLCGCEQSCIRLAGHIGSGPKHIMPSLTQPPDSDPGEIFVREQQHPEAFSIRRTQGDNTFCLENIARVEEARRNVFA
jgi:hypothetical protein